ncbi:beta-ketoacyl-[acyl-carrier-protein] synthase family protein [Desulfofustis glycolicus]|uniref:3-oxoacyl-[acyl-carrier-protein] synthase II n=1 Tax=Desulfofustis glycolicus DSM 9705 TaxID=1121409 RepID=A0A1M5UMW2_9BACT|nr:beta-ketoacyl-[acyl-carrier-protein] synthase family protein [Desulfofustis glycolicus]SHH64236.1 3-oxoacyl-[acyl-carrier-protein] synthase II [Desulfofustis glycolicus DSM 9705]
MGLRDVVVVGYDAISPLGEHLDEQWRKAAAGQSGIGSLTRFALPDGFPVRIAGQVPDIGTADYPFLSARHQAAWSSPVFKYALLTVTRALERSGLTITPEIAPRVAVTFGSAVGGLDAVVTADRRLQAENKLPHPYANPNSCINMVGGKVAIETGAQGPITAPITACATGLSSILIAALLLAQGRADVAICGAVDFALVEPIVAGFYTMNGIYIPKPGREDEPPQAASRPFSADRRGFVLSEGAAAIIVTTREFADAHGLKHVTELAGWGMTSDAHHFVAPYFPTVHQCMLEAIGDARLSPAAIDAVNAHATSTKVGDQVEYDALKAVFPDGLPPVSANKSLIGHAMGASSAIETVFTLHGMEQSLLLPTINYQPDPTIEIDCVAEGCRRLEQEYVLKNSFGFGGCNACAIFRRTG